MNNAIVVLALIAMLPTAIVGVVARTALAGFRFGWLATERLVLWALGD